MQSDKRPNPDRSLEALKAQLRALPQPPVPAHLEALLLASVPGAKLISSRRWAARATLLAVASAICVMATLAWRQYPEKNNLITRVQGQPAQKTPRQAFASTNIAAWREDPRLLDEVKLPAFTWPIDDTAIPRASSPIPADLLE
jgi:hypothetical protein